MTNDIGRSGRIHQCRPAAFVLRVDVGAFFQKQPDAFNIVCLCRKSQQFIKVAFRARVDQHFNDSEISFFRCFRQRRFAGFVLCIDVRSRIDQQFNNINVSAIPPHRACQRRLTVLIPCVDIRARVNQLFNSINVSVKCRYPQCRVPVSVSSFFCVDVRSRIDQQFDNISISAVPPHRACQRRFAVFIHCIDVRARVDQRFDGLRLPAFHRVDQRTFIVVLRVCSYTCELRFVLRRRVFIRSGFNQRFDQRVSGTETVTVITPIPFRYPQRRVARFVFCVNVRAPFKQQLDDIDVAACHRFYQRRFAPSALCVNV